MNVPNHHRLISYGAKCGNRHGVLGVAPSVAVQTVDAPETTHAAVGVIVIVVGILGRNVSLSFTTVNEAGHTSVPCVCEVSE
jgi:hypothetical protein